ncbi:MAG: hypothetical protein MUQ65_11685, partial [Armatimonadetes bacterium]|nr:hypothetical protein [Armatimonadota bacterium]
MSSRALGGNGVMWLIVVTALLCTTGLWADSTVLGPDDWQYRELEALAQAGLVSGHPKGPIGEWAGERMSRYEAASLTLRAVEGIGNAYREQGKALQQIAQADTSGEAPSATPLTVSAMDLARVEKLIEEFRTELV